MTKILAAGVVLTLFPSRGLCPERRRGHRRYCWGSDRRGRRRSGRCRGWRRDGCDRRRHRRPEHPEIPSICRAAECAVLPLPGRRARRRFRVGGRSNCGQAISAIFPSIKSTSALSCVAPLTVTTMPPVSRIGLL